jgi:acetyl-CoA C-acetyltransferase
VAPDNETPYPVAIVASSATSERPGMVNAAMELELPAARRANHSALEQCGIAVRELSLFELHDSSTVMAALSLEALGLCEPGGAMALAESGALALTGHFPTWTFGGHKGRGNAPGAVGVYQAVEATRQLRGEAGDNQVVGANSALIQCLGSFGSTAVTHVLRAKEA